MRDRSVHPKSSNLGVPRTFAVLWILASAAVPTHLSAQSEPCVLSVDPPSFPQAPAGDALHAVPHGQESGHSAFHGQSLYGVDHLYLAHLPVFMGAPRAHPHNFQVILEVGLDDAESKARYQQSRAQNAGTLYTVTPPPFDQTALVADYPGRSRLNRLAGSSIVRGHFEQGGAPILEGVTFEVERVVYFREFHLGGAKLEDQHYLVFGAGDDLFAAHLLSAPPDFDQFLAISVTLENPSEGLRSRLGDALQRGLYLSLPERSNRVETRVLAGGELSCDLDLDGQILARAVEIQLEKEVYCEAGEFSGVVIDRFNRPESCTG